MAEPEMTIGDNKLMPAYMAHHGYIGISVDVDGVDWAEIGEFIRDAYRLSAPKKPAALVD